MIGDTLVCEMVAHAAEVPQEEVCGLVVSGPTGLRLIRGSNIARRRHIEFDLGPEAWLAVGTDEEAVAVYHSHVGCGARPSLADLSACEASRLPWHIVTPGGEHFAWEPVGFEAPYEGRPYVYGVHDCYVLVRDYYRREFGIELREYQRPDPRRWDDSLERNFSKEGFFRVEGGEAKVGDVFLIQVAARYTNHCAVYVGDGKILHHVEGRLSKQDPFGGYWLKYMTHHLRHNDTRAK